MNSDLMTLAQIARRLGVTPAALSNWQRRYGAEFPQPVRVEKSRRLFRLDEINTFVAERGLGQFENPEQRRSELPEMIIADAFGEQRGTFLNIMGWSEDQAKAKDLIKRSIGELSNEGIPYDLALQFTASLAVRAMVAQRKITINPGITSIIESAAQEVDRWCSDRYQNGKQSEPALHTQISRVWEQSPLKVEPRSMTKAILETVEQQSKIFRHFEHATPQTFAVLISALADGSRTLNLGSGIGSLARAYGLAGRHVTGLEINSRIANIHSLLAALDGYQPDIYQGNVLYDFHPDWQKEPFDAVVVNPPWNHKVDPSAINISDPRWRALSEFRSRNTIDYFIETALAYLRMSSGGETHRAIVCVPPSWLFSEQAVRMRNFLIRNDYVECVIKLGTQFNLNNRLPIALLVLSKTGDVRQNVRMIDARELGRGLPGVSKPNLSARDIDQLVLAVNAPVSAEGRHLAVVDVPTSDLRSDRVNLDPTRYVLQADNLPSSAEAIKRITSAHGALTVGLHEVSEELTKVTPGAFQNLLRKTSPDPIRRLRLSGSGLQGPVRCTVKTRSKGEELARSEISVSDVAVSLGGASLGKALRGVQFNQQQVTWARYIVLSVIDPKIVLPDFLLAWATFGGLREHLESQKVGATTSILGRRALDDVSIPIPNIESQAEIVRLTTPILSVLAAMLPERDRFEHHLSSSVLENLPDALRELRDAASIIVQTVLGPIVAS